MKAWLCNIIVKIVEIVQLDVFIQLLLFIVSLTGWGDNRRIYKILDKQ